MNRNYFISAKTLDELKAEYRRLALLHHPDRGGNLETMQAVNAEYEILFKKFQSEDTAEARTSRAANETPEEFIKIIEKIIFLSGIEIEICGCWLWVTGETRQHKDALKAAGCKWAHKKLAWYWHPIGYKGGRGNVPLEDIRNKYGSIRIDAAGKESRYRREELPA